MERALKILTLFFIVSTVALFSMKAILWTLLQRGPKFALPLAFFLITTYLGSFHITHSKKVFAISKKFLIWIWALGFLEIVLLGGLYHLTPQYFPSFVGDFFFN